MMSITLLHAWLRAVRRLSETGHGERTCCCCATWTAAMSVRPLWYRNRTARWLLGFSLLPSYSTRTVKFFLYSHGILKKTP
jgi:hypothetical protein